ncbi:protein Peter pan isoform X2 [Cylas formicarius]|uniref:protein Peter pan isoform X2 n=1 Tax=Cylas formicarius TaxID=197179 RepID=UPI00295883AF|nr:protein Peter pan isoform X2 [Cylas formicarius]
MGKRRKKGRSVKRNLNVRDEPEEVVNAPHSFVIHKGLAGGHTLELTKDFRRVMEPFTASSLKERKKNTIKDFVAVAGPLHVTHLSIFSHTELGIYLKIMRLPRGPTLTFKIHNYSLSRDVVSSLKKQMVIDEAFKHSPLIILNSFSGEGLQMKLMASMFQNMFPTINLTNVDLNNIRRCVLLNYNPTTKLIDFRHYTIKIAPVGVSKGVKKVIQGKVPNLARCNDISEYFAKTAILSESEADDPSTHVTLPQKLISRGNIQAGKSSIRLTELGPRLTLQLIKIEDGLLDGEVLFHDLVHKSEEERLEIQKKRETKRKLKETRKKVQEENKKAKEKIKEEQKQKSLEGMKGQKSAGDNHEAMEEDDDREYYKKEIGEEPDQDLFSRTRGVKRPARVSHFQHNKKAKLNETQLGQNKTSLRKNKQYHRKSGKDVNKIKIRNKRGKMNLEGRDHRPIGGKFFKKKKQN